jgi:hypothetical protein
MRHMGTGLMLLCLMVAPVLTDGSEINPIPGEVELIVWEHQNWESNGGYNRLTLWRDGRSEVDVAPFGHIPSGRSNLRPKNGWTAERSEHHVIFVRRDIYPPEVARAKLQRALESGIRLLEAFRPGYHDGGGTRVVVQINGLRKETVIPMFMDRDKGTINYNRFLAVSKVLDGFDTDAYEMPSNDLGQLLRGERRR